MIASSHTISEEGVIKVRFAAPLDPDMERWFSEVLMNYRYGVVYIEYDTETRRLAGYGIRKEEYDNFRFWVGVALYGDEAKE